MCARHRGISTQCDRAEVSLTIGADISSARQGERDASVAAAIDCDQTCIAGTCRCRFEVTQGCVDIEARLCHRQFKRRIGGHFGSRGCVVRSPHGVTHVGVEGCHAQIKRGAQLR